MRLARGLLGTALWILAGLLGLVSILLCVTVVLLPLGIPLLKVSRVLFGKAVRLMMPPAVAHPLKHAGKKARKTKSDAGGVVGSVGKAGRKLARKQRKRLR